MSSLARRGAAIAALSACALAVPAAAARAQGGTEIGGTVDSMLKLSIDPPPPALATFPSHAGAPTVAIGVAVTATDAPVTLSIADGDHAATPRRGHMVHGTTILAKPLEATAGTSAFGPLDSPLGPLLRSWDTELGAARTTIRLRQRVTARELRRGPFTKTVLITVASGTL
jgi:hypothetical protein